MESNEREQRSGDQPGLRRMSRYRVPGAGLFALLVVAGLMITFVHDYAYRRGDVTGTGDYELNGLVSHAGTDILIVTVILAVTAWLWARHEGARR